MLKKTECLDANYPDAKIKNSNTRAKVASKDVYTEPLETTSKETDICLTTLVIVMKLFPNQS